MRKHWRYIILCGWMLLIPVFSCIYAQENTSESISSSQEQYNKSTIPHKKLDRKAWKKATKGMNFEDYKEKPKKQKKQKDWDFSEPTSPPMISPQLIQIFLYAIIILLFLGILYYLIKNGYLGINKNPSLQKGMDISILDEEEIDAPLDKLLKEALQLQNYKLAIRIYYLKVLKELQQLGKINWKKYKTNRHYLNEMLQDSNYSIFKDVTVQFEKNWFGPEETTKDMFAEIEPHFLQLLKTLDSKA